MEEKKARYISVIILSVQVIAAIFITASTIYMNVTDQLRADVALSSTAPIWYVFIIIITGLLLLLCVYSRIAFYIILAAVTFSAALLFFASLSLYGFLFYFSVLILPVIFYVSATIIGHIRKTDNKTLS